MGYYNGAMVDVSICSFVCISVFNVILVIAHYVLVRTVTRSFHRFVLTVLNPFQANLGTFRVTIFPRTRVHRWSYRMKVVPIAIIQAV